MLPKVIPDKLPGTVHRQYVRCGSPKCHCARGKLHGPYWSRFWRDSSGRQHKAYVRKTDLKAVRAAVRAAHAEQREIVKLLAEGSRAACWYEGQMGQGEDTWEEFKRALERYATVRRLARLACGDYGTVIQQVRAARLLSQIRDPRRAAEARSRQEALRERATAILRGTGHPYEPFSPVDRGALPTGHNLC